MNIELFEIASKQKSVAREKEKNPTDFLAKKLFVGDASDAHAVLVCFILSLVCF